MKLLILTEAGLSYGYGHIIRCLAIADAAKQNSIETTILYHGEVTIKGILDNYQVYNINWIQEFEYCLDKYSSANNIVLIDSYNADTQLYYRVSVARKMLIVIDDNQRIEYPKCLLINGSIGASFLNYNVSNYIKCLIGPQYQALRMEFWSISPNPVKKEIKNILINFGASDIRNLSKKIIPILLRNENYSIYTMSKTDFVSVYYEGNDSERLHLFHDLNTADLIKILQKIDLAISATGQTIYELACLGIPAIGIKIAENQSTNVKGWLAHNYIKYMGDWEDYSEGLILKYLNKLDNFDVRVEIGINGRKVIDGKGALRIVDEIIKLL